LSNGKQVAITLEYLDGIVNSKSKPREKTLKSYRWSQFHTLAFGDICPKMLTIRELAKQVILRIRAYYDIKSPFKMALFGTF
jgi:hypothetical protein